MPERGHVEVVRSSELFDARWYRERYPDVQMSGLDPATHYLEFGVALRRDPGPEFSTVGYLDKYPDVREAGLNPLVHFVLHGGKGKRTIVIPEAQPFGEHSDWSLLSTSELFDPAWYLEHYPACALADVDPVEHYLRVGAVLGYDPGPEFCTSAYVTRYRTVREAGVNPLVHYLRFGRSEGRDPGPLSTPSRSSEVKHHSLIAGSGLFDREWYVAHYVDVRLSGMDPILHYLDVGAKMLYDPSSLFNTRAYLETYADVREHGVNPLLHYLLSGRAEGRRIQPADTTRFGLRSRPGMRDPSAYNTLSKSELFDAEWYQDTYPDVLGCGLDPIEHYLEVGARLMRDPSPRFSTAGYALANPDVVMSGMNPLHHFLVAGRKERRTITTVTDRGDRVQEPRLVPRLDGSKPGPASTRFVAFYLPQFHPIAQNDEWWGKGFTEWTGVKPALPQFPNHYQPHVPGELGYYDLRDSDVQHKQVELAQSYGVDAFCFYFYWFDGTTLLEKPLENWLNDKTLDFPFMLCWANENWSRRWDGREDDVLIAQKHSPEDDLAFIDHVSRYLKDPRYTRIDGKPVLLVYRPGLLPDASSTAKRWRQWCRENGVGEIYLAYTMSFDAVNPSEFGFDAAIEFPPNNFGLGDATPEIPHYAGFAGSLRDWNDLSCRSFAYDAPAYRLYRGLCPSWDNTPRRGTNATVILGSSPAKFTRWATNAIRETQTSMVSADDNLIFVNAWNEWGEGAHLEPDQAHGYAWLESVRVAKANMSPVGVVSSDAKIALIADLTDSLCARDVVSWLDGAVLDDSLWVVVNEAERETVTTALTGSGISARVLGAPHGAGTLALLRALPEIESAGFDLVLRTDGPSFAEHARDAARLQDLVDRFAANPRLGVLRADGVLSVDSLVPWVQAVAARLGLEPAEVASLDMRAGGAFCARLSSLAPLACIAFDDDDTSPGGDRFVPRLGHVLDAALSASAYACGTETEILGARQHKGVRQRPSILLVTHDLHANGAQRLVLAMGRGYRDSGFDVHFVALGGGPMHGEFAAVGDVHIVDVRAEHARRSMELIRSIKRRGARVAIANTTVSGSLLPILKATGLIVVSLVHEMPSVLLKSGLERHARYIADLADVAVFPSAVVKDHFESFIGRPLANAVIRHQGDYLPIDEALCKLDARRALKLPEDADVMLSVGFGDHRKGPDLFGAVVADVLSKNPAAHAVWVGNFSSDGAFDEGREIIRRAGVDDRVHFPGLVGLEGLREYYAAADIFLLPSREDPFPSVVMQAMSAGLPVLAFDGASGAQELLESGAGRIVPAFDTTAMADVAGELLADPAEAERLGSVGHDIRDRDFSFNSYLFDLLDFAGISYPRISVVVPNYNYAQLLPGRLDSIDRQRQPVYEVIILDDGSSDYSQEVIDAYVAEHPLHARQFRNVENSGSVFKQWLKGASLATGDYVWIAEADDLADPDFLSTVVEGFADSDVVLSYAQSRAIDEIGATIMPDYLSYVSALDATRWTKSYIADGLDEIRAGLYVKNTIPNVSAVVFRKDALLEALSESIDAVIALRNAGDWLTYLRVLERGRVAFHANSLSSHRRHASSVTLSSFDIGQLGQILSVQADSIKRYGLGIAHAESARDYAQELYEQFGLATPEKPLFWDSDPLREIVQGIGGLGPLDIAVVTMQKDEGDLLDAWFAYHALLFGPRSIIVLDNGSTEATTVQVLDRIRATGATVEAWPKDADFERKGLIVSDSIASLDEKVVFAFPVDCDEFVIVWSGDEPRADRFSVHSAVATSIASGRPISRISRAIWNVPGTTGGYMQEQMKVGVVPRAGIRLDLGFHLYDHAGGHDLLDGELYFGGDLGLIHFHNRTLAENRVRARLKLKLRVPDFEPETLRSFQGTGRHLVRYFFMSEDDYMSQFPAVEYDVEALLRPYGVEVPFSRTSAKGLPDGDRGDS